MRHITQFTQLLQLSLIAALLAIAPQVSAKDVPKQWQQAWPETDFSQHSIDFSSIRSGGPPRDGIPSIDNPQFKTASRITGLQAQESVISLSINDDARAYPLRILMYHEIVNDVVGDVPVAVTYCPLCNASMVFKRNVEGQVLEFGTTGKLRKSDMVMYDRQSESWWQQFTGEAIVGDYTGTSLTPVPSRIESFRSFKQRHPHGKVLVPNDPNAKPYGTNPYTGYDDTARSPFLYRGEYDGPVPAMERVVAVGKDAWPLSLLRRKKRITHNGLEISWEHGRVSALDDREVAEGREVGNVTVTRDREEVVYHLPFAFAFKAFHPDGVIHARE